jgi:hypothetical protein
MWLGGTRLREEVASKTFPFSSPPRFSDVVLHRLRDSGS